MILVFLIYSSLASASMKSAHSTNAPERQIVRYFDRSALNPCRTMLPWSPASNLNSDKCNILAPLDQLQEKIFSKKIKDQASRLHSILEGLGDAFEAKAPVIALDRSNLKARGMITAKLNGHSFQLAAEISPEGTIEYVIPSAGTALHEINFDGPNNCLSITMNPKDWTSHIGWITSETPCNLPHDRAGSFILEVADTLNHLHRVRESHLSDMATVNCNQNPDSGTAPLGFLRVLKKGSTWYENFGFQPSEYDVDDYELHKRGLNEIALDAVSKRIRDVLMKSDHANVATPEYQFLVNCHAEIAKVSQLAREFKKAVHSKKHRLSEFVTWVWEKKCEDFQDITKVLFNDSSAFHNSKSECSATTLSPLERLKFPWMGDYWRFRKASLRMKKVYQSECPKNLSGEWMSTD
jgi:hypothetical protein